MKKSNTIYLFFIIISTLSGIAWAMESYVLEQEPIQKSPLNPLIEILDAITVNNINFLSEYSFAETKINNFMHYTEQIHERNKTLQNESHSPFTLRVLTHVGSLILDEYQKLTEENNPYYVNHKGYLASLKALS